MADESKGEKKNMGGQSEMEGGRSAWEGALRRQSLPCKNPCLASLLHHATIATSSQQLHPVGMGEVSTWTATARATQRDQRDQRDRGSWSMSLLDKLCWSAVPCQMVEPAIMIFHHRRCTAIDKGQSFYGELC